MRPNKNTPEKFWAQVKKTDGCWEWTGHKTEYGYGRVRWNGKSTRAHRLAIVLSGGTIPDGLVCDHVCRNRACVRPEHLRLVTLGINSVENSIGPTARNTKKIHCMRGHPFTIENTYKSARELGWRACRLCDKIRKKAKRKALANLEAIKKEI